MYCGEPVNAEEAVELRRGSLTLWAHPKCERSAQEAKSGKPS
jgi:hypothetical protein